MNAPTARALPHVAGHCPGCGHTSLHLEADGTIACTRLGCPVPDALARIIADTDTHVHIVNLDTGTFSVRHPLVERLDDRLLGCSLHLWLQALPGPPAPPGRYRAVPRPGRSDWNLERTTTDAT